MNCRYKNKTFSGIRGDHYRASFLKLYAGRFLIAAFITLLPQIIKAQSGINTNSPDPSAALDIVASDKGLLIPRVSLSNDLNSPSPISNPAVGLMIVNTGPDQNVGLYHICHPE